MRMDIQKTDIFLEIWLIFIGIFDTNACLTVKRGDSYIANSTFLVQDQTLVQQCAQLCMTFPICLSVTLSLHSLQCRLHAVIEEQYPELMVSLAGGNFVYIEKTDFKKEFVGEGHSNNCEIDTKYFSKLDQCIPYNFGPLVNVALGKSTASSSTITYGGTTFVSQLAVDGNWGSDAYNDGCAATNQEQSPWWTVDLVYPHIIHSITMQNPGDDNGGQLHDIKTYVGHNATSLQLCGTFDGPGYNGQRVEVTCGAPIVGSFVKILLNDNDVLTLCEVGVNANQLV